MLKTIKNPKIGTQYAASIDIGTNTVRFLVGKILPGGDFKPVQCGGAITRLGAGLKDTGILSNDRMNFTVSMLSGFLKEMELFALESIFAVATSAVREAGNGNEFTTMVLKETGLSIEVIDGREEARRMLLGVFWNTAADRDVNTLALDIGGGSTELIICRGEKGLRFYCTQLGVVHLTEEFLKSDPLNDADLARMQTAIQKEFGEIREHFHGDLPKQMISVAGTPTTLAAVHLKLFPYDPDQVHNFVLSREKIREIFEELRAMPLGERKKLPWLEEGRADLILPGTQITLAAMDAFGMEDMMVSEYGLREGILLNGLKTK